MKKPDLTETIPLKRHQLKKGTRITQTECEEYLDQYNIDDPEGYSRALQGMKQAAQKQLEAAGVVATIRTKQKGLYILTDVEASEYHHTCTMAGAKIIDHHTDMIKKVVDVAELTPDQKEEHNIRVNVCTRLQESVMLALGAGPMPKLIVG